MLRMHIVGVININYDVSRYSRPAGYNTVYGGGLDRDPGLAEELRELSALLSSRLLIRDTGASPT